MQSGLTETITSTANAEVKRLRSLHERKFRRQTGWFLADSLGFKPENRWMGGALGGLYCMLPGTSVLPVATIVTAVRQFEERGRKLPSETQSAQKPSRARAGDEQPITVDYREVDEDDASGS